MKGMRGWRSLRDSLKAVEEDGLDGGVAGTDAGFGDFEVPVAEVGPEEGAEGFGDVGEVEGVDGGFDGLDGGVQAGEDPAVFEIFEFQVSSFERGGVFVDVGEDKRLAFQILLAKFRPMSNLGEVLVPVLGSFTTGMRMSWVSVAMEARVKRSASAPWELMMSTGSTPLPLDLDMVRPSPSWMTAWM